MVCHQVPPPRGTAALRVGCIGDSITAGAHSSGPTKTYPAQLQAMLDPTAYAVTNLGACGSTMQKNADSPYWKRPQFTTLTSNKVRAARACAASTMRVEFSAGVTLSLHRARSLFLSLPPSLPLSCPSRFAVGHYRHYARHQRCQGQS